MLPGVGGGELIVIAVVALIVVGPKDLPKLLRQLGRFVAKMRNMADDFRASFEDMARQSELDDLRKEVEALRSGKSVSPVIDDLSHQMRSLNAEVSEELRPTGLGYSGGEYKPSYEEAFAAADPAEASVHDIPAITDMRAKPIKADTVADVVVKPRPARAKKAVAVSKPGAASSKRVSPAAKTPSKAAKPATRSTSKSTVKRDG